MYSVRHRLKKTKHAAEFSARWEARRRTQRAGVGLAGQRRGWGRCGRAHSLVGCVFVGGAASEFFVFVKGDVNGCDSGFAGGFPDEVADFFTHQVYSGASGFFSGAVKIPVNSDAGSAGGSRPDFGSIHFRYFGKCHLLTLFLRDSRGDRSEEHTSELQSRLHLVCRLLLEKKKKHRLMVTLCHSHFATRMTLIHYLSICMLL